jgi:trehalose 6-phosphate phosphatase
VIHWRGAADEALAEAAADRIANKAASADLIPHRGRKALELRPVMGIDKGSAVHRLLVDHAPLEAAIFAGDDRTDLDAFRAMKRLEGTSRLRRAVRVGVFTVESPPEIENEADMVVSGPGDVLEVLRELG